MARSTRKPNTSVVAPPGAPTSITPRMLTIQQAAVYTGATIWRLRELYWAKEVAGFIAGRRLLFDRASLDSWLDKQLSERMA